MNCVLRNSVWLGALAALLPARSVFAQNCVLCYTSAAAAAGGSSAAMHGLEYGILALLTPALLLFSGVFLLILRRARAANRPEAPAGAAHRAVVTPRPSHRLHWFRPAAPARN